MPGTGNVDRAVVESFGREWQTFDQAAVSEDELRRYFDSYFSIFPWEKLPQSAVGFDLGCGTGRWARFVASRVARLHCIDPSAALDVARRNLADFENVEFHQATVDVIPLPPSSMDFGYSLGVLHHIPDTAGGIAACVEKLKPGAPFLLYLYYDFENRPFWFRWTWRISDLARRLVSRLPYALRRLFAELAAAFLYWPLARLALLFEKMGLRVASLPLSAYRDRSFYQMRTDALDRFGTRREQRFRRSQIEQMMSAAGLGDIRFSEQPPFWCAVGFRK
jgi:SAM-dependent methyltransferase